MKKLIITQKVTDRTNETFKQYLKEINEIKPFTLQEENECAIKAFNGDEKALQELIMRNLRFVVSVAKQYATESIPLSDLINEGNIGMVIAAKKFDPNKGYKFISFAVWWVRKVILQHISNYGKMVRLPANKISNVANLEKQIHSLEQKNGCNVDILEVINHNETINSNNYSDDEFNDFLFVENLSGINVESIDKPFGNEEDGSTLADILESDFKTSDYLINDYDLKQEIKSVLSSLKPIEKNVIEALFGLNGKRQMTLKEVGDEPEFGITRERVRQIRNNALKKLENNQRMKRVFELVG